MKKSGAFFFLTIAVLSCITLQSQTRSLHYKPQGKDFVCVNGKMRFNRALYGTNTGFRVEAGDLPEFALYLPGMGGNFKFGLVSGNKSKWLIAAANIRTVYRPGSMIYEIRDPMLGNGLMHITVLALANTEGFVIKTAFVDLAANVELVWVFGGANGRKFSRDGDIGADPESSFYLKPEYCKDNVYELKGNSFQLSYGGGKILSGIFPGASKVKLSDAEDQINPFRLFNSNADSAPVVMGRLKAKNETNYFLIQNSLAAGFAIDKSPEELFITAENARKKLADRVKITTPDPYINTLGGALGVAADAIWEDPSFMHGAVAWRMRLNAWRGPYVADPLGWHDRARKHFDSYALSQVTSPPTQGVVADTALHLARQLEQIGTSVFSDGYICRNPNGDIRAHHYDMNLVFIDQLLNHFTWTGDTTYVRKMWTLLKRHLAWEKRNFDADGDGLYDAYAAIWASDALQYSGGGVTHSSAYNYRANKTMTSLAILLNEDPAPYIREADHILHAMNSVLWLAGNGCYAEYKDLLGMQLLHQSPGLWTIYHAIDSRITDPFQSFQSLKYIDNHIPRIPVQITGLPGTDMFLLSTTNWQPYAWSLNNVVLAENQHTALAYWQGNRPEEAYALWRASLLESMYLSASPGGFEQLSAYDAIRGELYRDFADPIGMVARTLVEGLFGVQPDALNDELVVQPGFPAVWNSASLSVPDIAIDFVRTKSTTSYTIIQSFRKLLNLKLRLRTEYDNVLSVQVNGKNAEWRQSVDDVGFPVIEIKATAAEKYDVQVMWTGRPLERSAIKKSYIAGEELVATFKTARIIKLNDPQQSIDKVKTTGSSLSARVKSAGSRTFFVHLQQGKFTWWEPISFLVAERPVKAISNGTAITSQTVFDKIDLTPYFNARVREIFQQQYLSPRPDVPTLQLPTQGIGNWCYPLIQVRIDDSGLRKLAGAGNVITTPAGVPFSTSSDSTLNNIVFTSQWDNFPKQVSVSLSGQASGIHLLMAGSTNPMQSRMTNGQVLIEYADGTLDSLQLKNPENWWPIEQDYFTNGMAFTTDAPKPLRFYLKQGRFGYGLDRYDNIKGFSNMAIDGGAATVLSMPLNTSKNLKSLTLQTFTNDVVIGLMSVTVQRLNNSK